MLDWGDIFNNGGCIELMKKALITGITGQDGSYLSELLLEKGYEVHGIIRRSSSFNTGRIEVDPRYYRPTEVDVLCGNPCYAKEKLGWEPKVKFKELVRIMIDADMEAEKLRQGRLTV